jgi:diguanylate cyclase (GGDEF)-like protein
MLDVDHFKRVNDTHGHPSGDDVIREVARRVTTQMRGTDVLGRYGGEEFAMLVCDADLTNGRAFAERVRRSIADEPIATRTGALAVTVSIGLAQATGPDDDVAAILARADEALYRAKQDGRNRTCAASEPAERSPLAG